MALLRLAWRSLRNRAFTTALTVLTVALAIALLLGVEQDEIALGERWRLTLGARYDSFERTVHQLPSDISSEHRTDEPPRLSWRPFGLSHTVSATSRLASCR